MSNSLSIHPIKLFAEWFEEAKHSSIKNINAAALATSTLTGKPSVRFILLKAFNEDGFVFYTNLMSRKAQELFENPQAALCFYWPELDKQIRIEGIIEEITKAEADNYFASRQRESKIAAWISKQSQPLTSLDDLRNEFHQYSEKFNSAEIPRPNFWSGFRLIPNAIEFWKSGEFRLHQRIYYVKSENNDWDRYYLYP